MALPTCKTCGHTPYGPDGQLDLKHLYCPTCNDLVHLQRYTVTRLDPSTKQPYPDRYMWKGECQGCGLEAETDARAEYTKGYDLQGPLMWIERDVRGRVVQHFVQHFVHY